MNSLNDIKKSVNITKIVEFLKNKTDLIAVYIFGSILGTGFNDESDIDIAIISGTQTDSAELYGISGDLSVILKRDVHLIDFLKAPDTLKIQILKNKNVIFCKNEDKRLYHEMNALTSYEKLNEEREIVIKAKYGESAWKLL